MNMGGTQLRVAVTGGTGWIGQAVVTELLQHGYDVRSIDRVVPQSRSTTFIAADMTHFGEVEAHLAVVFSRRRPASAHPGQQLRTVQSVGGNDR